MDLSSDRSTRFIEPLLQCLIFIFFAAEISLHFKLLLHFLIAPFFVSFLIFSQNAAIRFFRFRYEEAIAISSTVMKTVIYYLLYNIGE